jgi:hypothetical protein
MYADFAKVAAKNPVAWSYGNPTLSEEVIGMASKKNRMISFPCKAANRAWDYELN